MVRRHVPTDVLRLVEVVIVNSFFHSLSQMSSRSHNADSSAGLVCVAQNVGVSYVLGVNAASTLDHGELLSVEVLVGIRCEAPTVHLLAVLLVVAPGCKIRKFLLRLTELVIGFLFI